MNRLPTVLLALALLGGAVSAQSLGGHVTYTDEQGRVLADSSHFRAVFTADRATIAVPAQAENGTEPQLELQLVAAVRGGMALETDADGMPSQRRDRIEIARGGLVERYEVDDDGFEQSFLIAARPAGTGDLRVTLQVGGNVSAPVMPAAHRAIVFRHDGAEAIRYGEAHVVDRGGHHARIDTAYDGAGRLELIVPSSFLDAAVYPVVIDPAVGPTWNPGGSGYDDDRPDVGYDRYDETGFWIVWERRFSPSQVVIRAQQFTRGGAVAWPVIAVTSTGVSTRPAIGMDGSNALICYESNDRIVSRYVHGHTEEGPAVVEAPKDISTPAVGERDQRPSICTSFVHGVHVIGWDRTLAGATNPQEIIVRYIGKYDLPNVLIATNEQVLESVPASSGYVSGIRLPATCGQRLISAAWKLAQHRYRAVWDRFYTFPAPGDYDVRSCTFRAESSRSHPGQFPFNFTIDQTPGTVQTGIGTDERTPSVGSRDYGFASAPGEMNYCVAWEAEGDIKARLFNQTGPLGATFDVRTTPAWQGMPSVGAGLCEYTIAYGEAAASGGFAIDIRAARVLADGTVTVNDRPIDVGTGVFQNHIRASAGFWDTSGAPQPTNGSMIVWMGETGPSGAALSNVRSRVFEPVDALATWYGTACPGPGGLTPQIDLDSKPLPAGTADFIGWDAPPGSVAVLVCSNQLVNLPLPGAPGCNAYVGTPWVASWVAIESQGRVTKSIEIPCTVPTPFTLGFQWAFLVPGHNALGLIVSDDIDVTWIE